MFTSISLTNFKCFATETTFPLSKINLLTGINGRGKSSFLQALLLFKQSVEKDKYTNCLYLNGDYVKLHTYNDAKNRATEENERIEIKFEIDAVYNLNYKLKSDVVQDVNAVKIDYINNQNIDTDEDGLLLLIPRQKTSGIETYKAPVPFESLFIFRDIHYIAADRIGPKFLHQKQNIENYFITLTPNGDNATTIFFTQKSKIINKGICIDENQNFEYQTNTWLSYIFDTDVKVEVIEFDGTLFLYFHINGVKFKPTNVGFGYSDILPILLAGMVANENHTLIIENPEAHLHPKAQHRLTEFLARVASCGVQIFVESHSEHILNGLSTAVADKNIPLNHSDVSVLYFSEKAPNTHFFPIPMLEGGKIDEWPAGFFDQADLDYQTIYGH